MEFVLTSATAATTAMLLVAMFKLAYPTTTSLQVVLCSLLSGVGLSFLVTMGQGKQFDQQTIALTIIAGIVASATAAGVRSADNKADEKREDAARPSE